jgi:pimeloyl-ACP methyl ester carboxylesterase
VPHARMLQIDGAGHSPHRDRPDAVIAAAASFMRST